MTSYLFALFLLLAVVDSAQALSHLGEEPPDALIVDRGALEWVYAGPCAPSDPSCGVVSLHHSFVIPDDAAWNASFSSLNDLLAAFNIPNGPVPNAAPYFNVAYDHIDISDAQGGYIWGTPFAPDAEHRWNPVAEAFLVRGVVGVPEPATMLPIGLGLVGIAGLRRKFSN